MEERDDQYDMIPEEFIGIPPDLDRCAWEKCKHHAEYGGVFCVYHKAASRDEERRAWALRRQSGG